MRLKWLSEKRGVQLNDIKREFLPVFFIIILMLIFLKKSKKNIVFLLEVVY